MQVCERCGSGDGDGNILLCDQCDRGFHLFCLVPRLCAVPDGNWCAPACDAAAHN